MAFAAPFDSQQYQHPRGWHLGRMAHTDQHLQQNHHVGAVAATALSIERQAQIEQLNLPVAAHGPGTDFSTTPRLMAAEQSYAMNTSNASSFQPNEAIRYQGYLAASQIAAPNYLPSSSNEFLPPGNDISTADVGTSSNLLFGSYGPPRTERIFTPVFNPGFVDPPVIDNTSTSAADTTSNFPEDYWNQMFPNPCSVPEHELATSRNTDRNGSVTSLSFGGSPESHGLEYFLSGFHDASEITPSTQVAFVSNPFTVGERVNSSYTSTDVSGSLPLTPCFSLSSPSSASVLSFPTSAVGSARQSPVLERTVRLPAREIAAVRHQSLTSPMATSSMVMPSAYVSSLDPEAYKTKAKVNAASQVRRSSDGSYAIEAIRPRPRESAKQSKVYCTQCDDVPNGFKTGHELNRHHDREHAAIRPMWICVDASPSHNFLTHCKACNARKQYPAYYNAASHLRRIHFNPCKRGRRSQSEPERRGGKTGGRDPPMAILKSWMRCVYVDTDGHEVDPSFADPLVDETDFAE